MKKHTVNKHTIVLQKNERNYANSTGCNNSTKLLPRSNGTNVEVRNNIENIEDL